MYSFEMIKHNVVQIIPGRSEIRKKKVKEDSSGGNDYTTHYKKTFEVPLQGYFFDKPQIQIAQTWNDDTRVIQKTATGIRNFTNTISKSVRELSTLKDKSNEALGKRIGTTLLKAITQLTERSVPSNALEWGGSSPTIITMDFILMKEFEPVFKKDLFPLLEISGYSGADVFGFKGPRGYNGFGYGIIDVNSLLRGEKLSLTSLYVVQNGINIIRLNNIVVVESVQITGSEQLYSYPSTDAAYKWIKASITFRTACPLPAPSVADEHLDLKKDDRFNTLGSLL